MASSSQDSYERIMDIPLLSLNDLITNQDHQIRMGKLPPILNPERVPILLSGGVGDVIMSIPVAEELAKLLGEVEVYTPHPETFDYFNTHLSLPKAKKIPVPDYTWFLEINTVARFRFSRGFTGFNHRKVDNLWKFQQDAFSRYPKLETLVRNHPLQDTAIARYARDAKLDRREFPFHSLGIMPSSPVTLPYQERRDYITLHDGYETASAYLVGGRATKTWNWNHWNTLVRSLKKSYPEYEIIQLGTVTGRIIDGVDTCLLNKTTLIESFEILKHSRLHIDGDSGLVHAATAMQTPCVVLFGPTPDYFYGYPQNHNLRSNFCPDACYWLTKDWLGKCPIGLDRPQCMDEITVDEVLQKALKVLT